MVDKICDKLMDKVHAKMPEVDEERAEIIRYGFELIIGEVPKLLIMFVFAIALNLIKYFLISLVVIGLYRIFSGGVHLKTHIGCFITTNLIYFGNIYMSKAIKFTNIYSRYICTLVIFVFSIIMILMYAPADTDMVPILRKKDRINKKVFSIIVVIIIMGISVLINDNVISNLCIFGVLLQTLAIMNITYKLFKVKPGYLEYKKSL